MIIAVNFPIQAIGKKKPEKKKKKIQGFNGIRTRDLRVSSIWIKCTIVTFEFYNRSPPTQRFSPYLSHLDQQLVEE